jgi:hypothetical protein
MCRRFLLCSALTATAACTRVHRAAPATATLEAPSFRFPAEGQLLTLPKQVFTGSCPANSAIDVLVSSTSLVVESAECSGEGVLTVEVRFTAEEAQEMKLQLRPARNGELGELGEVKFFYSPGLALASSVDGTPDTLVDGWDASLSADGRYISFISNTDSFADGAPGAGGKQVYRKDLWRMGEKPVLVSSSEADVMADGDVGSTSISGDGRYVFFTSLSPSLTSSALVERCVRKDVLTGDLAVVHSTDGTIDTASGTGAKCARPSADGSSALVFASSGAGSLYPSISGWHFFLATLGVGLPSLVSSRTGSTGTVATDNIASLGGASGDLSDDGLRAVFYRTANSGLVGGVTTPQVYLRDYGAVSSAPVLVSSLDGSSSAASLTLGSEPKISGDGKYAFFISRDAAFGGNTSTDQLFRKSLDDLSLPPTIVSSLDSLVANQNSLRAGTHVSISWDRISDSNGRYVVFLSKAVNFGVDADAIQQAFVKDMDSPASAPLLVSSASADGSDPAAEQSDATVYRPGISADGRYLFFEAAASNLYPGADGTSAVYVKQLY